MTAGRPRKYADETDKVSYRIPGSLDRFVRARAAALGVSRTEALILVLLDVQAEGPAALRSVQHKAEAEAARRQVAEVIRALDAANGREAKARKKAKDLAFAYRTLAASVNVRSDRLRESIRARLAALGE